MLERKFITKKGGIASTLLPQIYHKLNLLNAMVQQIYKCLLYCATLIVEQTK